MRYSELMFCTLTCRSFSFSFQILMNAQTSLSARMVFASTPLVGTSVSVLKALRCCLMVQSALT